MALIKCPNCHKDIQSDASFCPYCGKQLDNQGSEPLNEVVNTENEPSIITEYKKEIEEYRTKRATMIFLGILMFVAGFIFTVVGMAISGDMYGGESFIALYIIGILLLIGAEPIIVVGAVTNSIKIKKRENKIDHYKRTGEVL